MNNKVFQYGSPLTGKFAICRHLLLNMMITHETWIFQIMLADCLWSSIVLGWLKRTIVVMFATYGEHLWSHQYGFLSRILPPDIQYVLGLFRGVSLCVTPKILKYYTSTQLESDYPLFRSLLLSELCSLKDGTINFDLYDRNLYVCSLIFTLLWYAHFMLYFLCCINFVLYACCINVLYACLIFRVVFLYCMKFFLPFFFRCVCMFQIIKNNKNDVV